MISEFGGLDGILASAGLESALARPAQFVSFGDERRPAVLAAGLAIALIKNHPFIDGNSEPVSR